MELEQVQASQRISRDKTTVGLQIMSIVVIRQTQSRVVDFGGELEGVVEGEGGGEEGGGTVGGVGVGEGGDAGGVGEAGDVFVAVVVVVEWDAGGIAEEEGAGGDGLGGVPDIGLVGRGVGAAELADAEEVLVDEALEEVEARGERAHGDAPAHAVEGHRDLGVAGLPADGAVFGIVND